jgi:outer membrane protein OmpA-like peptidoglycan-associated protein
LYQLYPQAYFLPNNRGVKTYFFLFVVVFCLLAPNTSLAQKPKSKFKKGGVVQLNDSLTAYSQSDIFLFPNLNKIKFYVDAKKLRVLADYPRTDIGLYNLTKEYVSNFGIENFYRSTSLLWEFAKLSKDFGPKGEAVLLYKMVLKHHRTDINESEVQQEYDSLTKNKKENYVPLKYYYELVDYRKEIDTLRPPHGVLVNMGALINSPDAADYGPSIGHRDDVLLFTSKRNRHKNSFEQSINEDIFFSLKQEDQWQWPEEFKNINTGYNEGSACLSKDGKHLFFSRCNAPGIIGNCDILMADMQADSTWGNVRNMGPLINSIAWDSHPSLSHSGDTLFFASDRLGGFGLSDIYYTTTDVNGKWTKAKNAGPIINTRKNEVSPFFHHRFNVLYFSSDGHPLNFGEFDIYKSHKKGSTWGEPKNTGPLVNGEGSEYYFTIDTESSHLYYARTDASEPTNLDLYSFPVPMEAQPQATAILTGTLKNKSTGQPLKGIVSIIDLDKGVEVAPQFLREDGSFDFNLINKRNYLLIIQGDDFFRVEETFYLDGDTEMNREAEPIESKIAFDQLEFENGKADILQSMHQDLDRLANFLIDHPKFKLFISGHTDSQGKEDANLRLSQARADAIKAYLTYTFKIEPERIDAHGYGSEKPIVNEEQSDADRKLNRRVEFEIRRN